MCVCFILEEGGKRGGGEAPVSLLSSRGFKGCLCAKERRRGRGGTEKWGRGRRKGETSMR